MVFRQPACLLAHKRGIFGYRNCLCCLAKAGHCRCKLSLVINGFLSAFILYVLLGLSPQAVTITVLITGIAELFYHWNVRTPYWLGFLFQRPESHCVHHRQGHHRNNFSDLPLWDMLFGTFENPRIAPESCGFANELERQILPMLCGKDVLVEDVTPQISQTLNAKGKLL